MVQSSLLSLGLFSSLFVLSINRSIPFPARTGVNSVGYATTARGSVGLAQGNDGRLGVGEVYA